MAEKKFFRKVKKIEIIASRLVSNLLSGNYRSVFKGQGIEFDEVREYEESDDSRLIDWNVTARIGAAYTKVFKEEREITLFLIVDLSASMFKGSGDASKSEMVYILFAILGLSAVVNNDKVGAVFFTDRIERWVNPAKGKKHVLSLINDLVQLKPEGAGSDLGFTLKSVYESLKRRGICVIISDFKTAGCWEELSLLARRHDVIAVKLTDPVDQELPDTGTVEIYDPESDRTVMIGGPFKKIRNFYHLYWRKHYAQWLHYCNKRKIRVLSISSSDDPGTKLYQFFQKRKR